MTTSWGEQCPQGWVATQGPPIHGYLRHSWLFVVPQKLPGSVPDDGAMKVKPTKQIENEHDYKDCSHSPSFLGDSVVSLISWLEMHFPFGCAQKCFSTQAPSIEWCLGMDLSLRRWNVRCPKGNPTHALNHPKLTKSFQYCRSNSTPNPNIGLPLVEPWPAVVGGLFGPRPAAARQKKWLGRGQPQPNQTSNHGSKFWLGSALVDNTTTERVT